MLQHLNYVVAQHKAPTSLLQFAPTHELQNKINNYYYYLCDFAIKSFQNIGGGDGKIKTIQM